MAGPLTIQRVPKGLLHALAMKGSGQLPTSLSDQVAGVFDATSFYLIDNVRSAFGGTAAVTADSYYTAGGNALTVPPGEIWLPLNLSVTKLNVGLGTNFTVNLGYTRDFANSVCVLPAQQVIPADGDLVLGYEWPGPVMIATPGDNFGLYTSAGTYGANPTLNLILTYYRLEI